MNSNSPDNLSPMQKLFDWVKNTPERAINEAFEEAVSIKKIEEDYFNGEKIFNDGSVSVSVFNVFEIDLRKHLRNINLGLNFYRVSASLPYLQTQSGEANKAANPIAKYGIKSNELDPVSNGQLSASQLRGNSSKFSIYQKLAFIDLMINKYQTLQGRTIDITPNTAIAKSYSAYPASNANDLEEIETGDEKFQLFGTNKPKNYRSPEQPIQSVEKSILPGSFFKAFDRVKRNLSDSYVDYEKDIVEELRQSRQRINKALRYIIILVLTVITVQFASKTFIFSPMINSLIDSKDMTVKFSPAIEERAFNELRMAKEKIEFDYMIKSALREEASHSNNSGTSESEVKSKIKPENSPESAQSESPNPKEEVEILLQRESIKVLKKYKEESLNGVKNLLADITASFVFYLFWISGRQDLITIKAFLDEFLYSLNDNAKAFLIIIATDTFVGFHSSEGWDALLTIIFQHFGLPENKILSQSFISTVPVFLDGLFKFWIFQYLTQASPATATIYREMNE